MKPPPCQFGVSQKAVDLIKFNRSVDGLDEKEAVVIQMGRQILREHKLEPELFAPADQQLPPDRPPLLPAR